MKILGYSERGIINSLVFSIGEDKELMDEFISLINIPEIEKLKDTAKDYTILLEQSFSRFGDADLVIIIHYKKPENNKVLFIEGKVKTSSGNWNIQYQFDKYDDEEQYKKKEKYSGYSSNLFFQLYLKQLLFNNFTISEFEKGVIEPKFDDIRKIGENKVVLKAIKKIKKCKVAYYIGLIPTKQVDIDKFESKIDFDMHFLSWEKVYEFCKNEQKLKKVVKIFKYNKGQIY